jgi:hypothetical protein
MLSDDALGRGAAPARDGSVTGARRKGSPGSGGGLPRGWHGRAGSAGLGAGGGAWSGCHGPQRSGVPGPGEPHRCRRRGHAVAVQVVAAVPPPESPQGIAVPADRVGNGAGEVGGVEVESVGRAQHLPADLVRGEGGDQSGGVADGTDPPLGPSQPVGPAGQPVVDDEVDQRRSAVQSRTQPLGTALLGQRGGVQSVGQGRRGGPGIGRAQQLVGRGRRRADRLGRSLSGVISTIETLTERRVLLRSLREGIDCSTPTGRMLAGIFAAPGGLREGAEARAGGSRSGCAAGTPVGHRG